MDPINFLVAAGLVHCALFFFNLIFRSCSHYPYLYFLENTGLEIKTFSVKWFTTAFNRPLVKWGTQRSRFWTFWFSLGVVVTIILLPVASFILLNMVVSMLVSGPKTEKTDSPWQLEPMIPGVNVPFADIQYYAITLGLCSIVHELGHALAATREDVQLYGVGLLLVYIVPVAFVSLNSEQLAQKSLQSQLRILCAGVWHNIVLAVIAAAVFVMSSWIWAPLFHVNSGVVVKSIQPNSPLLGPTGLLPNDVVWRINDCHVLNSDDWYNCILKSVKHPHVGYCLTESTLGEHDESVPVWTSSNGEVNCCRRGSESEGKLCFEYMEGSQQGHPLQALQHSCLAARTIIEKSYGFCGVSQQCSTLETHCMKPILDNITKIVQMRRDEGKDVIFFGYPGDIYRTVEVSEWIPKYSFVSSALPESLSLLCKYVTVLSAGLAVINVVPCFFFDGQHILTTLVQNLLRHRVQNRSLRQAIAMTITSIGSFVLVINVVHAFLQRQR